MPYRFVSLGYSHSSVEATSTPLIMLLYRSLGRDGKPRGALVINMAEDWRSIVHREDMLYIELVVSEIRDCFDDQTLQILSELSSGCLRTIDSGVCEYEGLPVLMPFGDKRRAILYNPANEGEIDRHLA